MVATKPKVTFLCYWKVHAWRYKGFTWQSQYDWHIFMPELYIKYAGPQRRAWWGAILNSYQEPNHWKTLTGFQCGLPGQHEQELSTMTAELQKTLRVAQNNRGTKQKRKPSVYRDKSGKTMNTCWEYFCTVTKGWKFECSSRRGAFLCPAVCQLAVLAAALVTSIPLIHCMYKYTSKHTSLITLKVFEGFQPENKLKSIQEKRIIV